MRISDCGLRISDYAHNAFLESAIRNPKSAIKNPQSKRNRLARGAVFRYNRPQVVNALVP
ncbi:MAG: hypothetical protein DMG09_27700 [Acidobacteria bacterium]|nr:MAG: hypothetical protein DMG09_27700 [Acidobacteriota bacterium]